MSRRFICRMCDGPVRWSDRRDEWFHEEGSGGSWCLGKGATIIPECTECELPLDGHDDERCRCDEGEE